MEKCISFVLCVSLPLKRTCNLYKLKSFKNDNDLMCRLFYPINVVKFIFESKQHNSTSVVFAEHSILHFKISTLYVKRLDTSYRNVDKFACPTSLIEFYIIM